MFQIEDIEDRTVKNMNLICLNRLVVTSGRWYFEFFSQSGVAIPITKYKSGDEYLSLVELVDVHVLSV